jgi:peptidoglycan/xylan/chitin deacetylase (PgdA/CDA1 family)
MKLSTCFAALLLALPMLCCAQRPQRPAPPFEIARYQGNRTAAISYTFDDGLKEHYTIVMPELAKRGIAATFWIIGKTPEGKPVKGIEGIYSMTWGEIKTLAERGHEIGNHAYTHPYLVMLPPETIQEEVFKCDSAIEANIGIRPRTFCYPYNAINETVLRIAKAGRVGTRTAQIAIGGNSTPESLDAWVTKLIETRDWGVGMTHGITQGYDSFPDPNVLWNHLDRVKAQDDVVWVAPFADVAAYTAERDNIGLQVSKTGDGYVVTPMMSLDKSLFTQPLTMIVDAKLFPTQPRATQDGKSLTVTARNGKWLFDFAPGGGAIRLQTP